MYSLLVGISVYTDCPLPNGMALDEPDSLL